MPTDKLEQAALQEAAGGCPDNAGMSLPAHRVIAAAAHAVPKPFRAFAVRSDEPCHAFDARSPYGCVHVVATDFLGAAARAGLARTGYASVDIAEPFAVDYAATTLADSGPRRAHATMSSTAACEPATIASTLPSWRLRTQPATPMRRAACTMAQR